MTKEQTLTLDKLNEALALVKALSPKQAPDDLLLIKGATGLNIMKNKMLPPDTIIVSKDLFDMIYEVSEKDDY